VIGPALSVRLTQADVARFRADVVVGPAQRCWPWTGPTMGSYGRFRSADGVVYRAHRVAYVLAHGVEPDGPFVRQTCGNRLCCNPGHLYPASTAGNRTAGLRHAAQARPRARHRKLTVEEVAQIRVRLRDGERQKDLATAFGVTRQCIAAIEHGRTWR